MILLFFINQVKVSMDTSGHLLIIVLPLSLVSKEVNGNSDIMILKGTTFTAFTLFHLSL